MRATNQFNQSTRHHGYELPKAAIELINIAELSDWLVGWQWSPEELEEDFVRVCVADKDSGEQFQFVWHSRNAGPGRLRLFSKLTQDGSGRPWRDGPSLKAAIFRMREVHDQRS